MSGTAQPVERMLPNAVHFREFQNDPVTGHHYTGTCGETALATAMVCATALIENTADAINLMMSMAREMIALGWASNPQASTTTAHLRDEAHRRKFATDDSHYVSYQEPLDMNWLHGVLLEFAGIMPIILEVARAGNLDSFNGGNDERGVKYHFICVVGINADGYVCNDGDNSAISSHLVVYPWSEIEQARPCGILMLEMQEATPVTLDIKDVGGYFEASGNDWKCKSNGILVQDSVLDFYRNMPSFGLLNGMTEMGLPLHDKFFVGPVAIQVFERGVIVYDPADAAGKRKYDSPPGVGSSQCYKGHVNDLRVLGILTPALQAQLDKASADLKAAQGQVKDLQAQVAALQNQEPVKANDPLADAVRAMLAEAKKEGVI